MFKIMFIVYEREGLARDEALHYWREQHGPLASKVPGLRQYSQTHALSSADGSTAPFLGSAEMVFDSQAAFVEATSSPEFDAVLKDVINFADPDNVPTAVVEDFNFVG
ncbi:MAG: EthD family reductase [Gemmatimonadales bacterium]